MATIRRWRQSRWLPRLVALWLATGLVIASTTPWRASAQNTDDPWAEPLNLSHSGAATNPAIVIDSDGAAHAVWQDDFANYVYARDEGDQWSAPQPTHLHLLFGPPPSQSTDDRSQSSLYTGPNPLFVAGPEGYIFAFWITPEGALFTSRVRNRDFIDVAAWDQAQLLSSSAASFAAAIDARGDLHQAYLRTVDDAVNPAGIYYTRSQNNGLDWDVPKLLYKSPYFRRLDNEEANLSLATGGTADAPLVYIAWDNRPRKQVFLVRSADGGSSWEQPMQIAGLMPGSDLAGPYDIRVGAKGNSVVLIWQNARPEGACTQYFQFSNDSGATWSESQSMMEDLLACARANEFVTSQGTDPEEFLYLLTGFQDQIFLSAWDHSQWSEPQPQPILSGFVDPEIYTQVIYACHQATLFAHRLYIVGCDRGGGGDIWLTSRAVDSTMRWFSPPVWSQPSLLTDDNLLPVTADLVATGDGLIHAFFSQHQDTAIYYTRWDGTTWSRVTPVLEMADGEVGWPTIGAGPGNQLFLVARSNRGSLYFIRASSGAAITASDWSSPTRLPIAHDGRISPADVASDAAGTLHLAYSVPVNDERGVYLVQSKDQGKSWSEPIQVFNGAAAGFDLVGSPSLWAAEDDSIHIMWKQLSIEADGFSRPISLYYARSFDAGQTFSPAERVVEAPVSWQAIITDGNGNLHRLWQQADMVTTLFTQVSIDHGQSWQETQLLPAEGGTAAVTPDSAGRLHLIDVNPGSLSHWLWDGSRWQIEAPLHWLVTALPESPVVSAGSAINLDGKMVVVIAASTGAGSSVQRHLLYATRTLDLGPGQFVSQDNLTQSLPPSTNPAAISPPESATTPAALVENGSDYLTDPIRPIRTNNSIAHFSRVLLPVALLLLSFLGLVAVRAVRVKDR